MSTESSMRHKFSKKPKFAGGPSTKRGNKKAESSFDDNEFRNKENGARRYTKSRPGDHQHFRGGRQQGSNTYGKSEGSFRRRHDEQRNSKPSMRDNQSRGGQQEVNFIPDRKRKRIYADQEYMNSEGTSDRNAKAFNRKALSKNGQDLLNNDFAKVKTSNSPPRSIWVSSRLKNATAKSKNSSNKLKDKEACVEVPDGKQRTKTSEIHETNSVEVGAGGSGTLKKHALSKSGSSKGLDQSQNKHPNDSISRSANITISGKKILDPEFRDFRPKKKKRSIRIGPYDTSNKRLDDGIVTNEKAKEKVENLEKNVEMSKNAEFRAIQPSQSILNYVEDNLLGRRRLAELRRAGYNTNLPAPLDNIPSAESSERMRIEENIFRNKMKFFAAAKVSTSFPPPNIPEVAFAGRSNVGKSSLLNSLTRQWGVARTSDKPGLTQSINFFELGSKLCLVDLPGYGFAYAKEEVKEDWEDLVMEYVSTRVGLKRVCLLVDTKWGLKPRDCELIDLMERFDTKYQIVLTKTDLVFPVDVARRAMQIEESLKGNKSIVQPLMMVSSKTGAGIRSLRTALANIARFAKLKV